MSVVPRNFSGGGGGDDDDRKGDERFPPRDWIDWTPNPSDDEEDEESREKIRQRALKEEEEEKKQRRRETIGGCGKMGYLVRQLMDRSDKFDEEQRLRGTMDLSYDTWYRHNQRMLDGIREERALHNVGINIAAVSNRASHSRVITVAPAPEEDDGTIPPAPEKLPKTENKDSEKEGNK